MKNNILFNKEKKQIEVTLMGDFNDDWFSEDSISKNSVKDILAENNNSDLVVNLSSLGGSVDTALSVYDMVKYHKGHTTVKMFGRNASSSTFFSSAFDDVQISESGMFLIHNVWGGVFGNAEELRKQADEFEKHDAVIIDIYKKKTGLPKAEIKELMNLGKWYNAKEAKKFGFVDSIFKPSKSQNIIKQSIYNKYLPIMENNENKGIHIADEKSFLEKISNVFKPEIKDVSEATKEEFENKIKEGLDIENSLKLEISELKETIENSANQLSALEKLKEENAELKNKLTKEVAEPTKSENEQDIEGELKLSETDQSLVKDFNKLNI